SGAWVWEVGCVHFAPGLSVVFRPTLRNSALLAAAKELNPVLAMQQNCRLNRAEFTRVIESLGLRPGLSKVFGALEMNAPAMVFGARWAEKRAIRQQNWLVFARAKNSIRQAFRLGPGSSI